MRTVGGTGVQDDNIDDGLPLAVAIERFADVALWRQRLDLLDQGARSTWLSRDAGGPLADRQSGERHLDRRMRDIENQVRASIVHRWNAGQLQATAAHPSVPAARVFLPPGPWQTLDGAREVRLELRPVSDWVWIWAALCHWGPADVRQSMHHDAERCFADGIGRSVPDVQARFNGYLDQLQQHVRALLEAGILVARAIWPGDRIASFLPTVTWERFRLDALNNQAHDAGTALTAVEIRSRVADPDALVTLPHPEAEPWIGWLKTDDGGPFPWMDLHSALATIASLGEVAELNVRLEDAEAFPAAWWREYRPRFETTLAALAARLAHELHAQRWEGRGHHGQAIGCSAIPSALLPDWTIDPVHCCMRAADGAVAWRVLELRPTRGLTNSQLPDSISQIMRKYRRVARMAHAAAQVEQKQSDRVRQEVQPAEAQTRPVRRGRPAVAGRLDVIAALASEIATGATERSHLVGRAQAIYHRIVGGKPLQRDTAAGWVRRAATAAHLAAEMGVAADHLDKAAWARRAVVCHDRERRGELSAGAAVELVDLARTLALSTGARS